MKFKEKFIAFIMKKWTAPTVCGVCIALIFVMSVNSFAKYYTRVQEARAASVAVYSADITNNEQIWSLGQAPSGNGIVPKNITALTGNDRYDVTKGQVIIYMGPKNNDAAGNALPYNTNKDFAFVVSNKLNEKVCEVSLSYTITITFPEELPQTISWTLLGSDQAGTHYSNTHKSQTFTSSSFKLPAGTETNNVHTIQFYSSGVSYKTTDKYLEGVTITITTTQIQG